MRPSTRSSAWPKLPPAVVVTLVLLVLYHLVGVFGLIPDRQSDFLNFHTATADWLVGQPARLPDLNHPIARLLFAPFALLPFRTAALLWTLGSIGVALLCLRRIARETGVAVGPLVLLVFASAPVAVALGLGQVTFVLLPILTAAWLADRAGHTERAAGWLGLLTVLKPFYGLYGLYLLWRREWRAAAVYGGTIVLGYALGLLLVGVDGYRTWIAEMRAYAAQDNLYNASVWALATRLLTPAHDAWTPLVIAPALVQTVGGGLAALLLLGLWRALSGDRDRDYAAIGLAAVLLSPLGWLHYLPVVTAPVVATLARRSSRSVWGVGVVAVVPPLLLINQAYGVGGTIVVGSWAFVIATGLLLCVAEGGAVVGVLPRVAGRVTALWTHAGRPSVAYDPAPDDV
jgi:alpha-1,2-mannosyltransferase